jgi:hypothetical protein
LGPVGWRGVGVARRGLAGHAAKKVGGCADIPRVGTLGYRKAALRAGVRCVSAVPVASEVLVTTWPVFYRLRRRIFLADPPADRKPLRLLLICCCLLHRIS